MEWDDAFRDFCKGLEEGVLPGDVPVERADADGLVVLGSDTPKDTPRHPLGAGHMPKEVLPLTQAGETAAPKPVIMCGDFNVAHNEIDLKNPGPNRGNAGFSDEERGKFSDLLAAGFTDTFRTLHPDTTGAYSWWSYRFNARKNNAGWRIDYFLVSDGIADKVEDASIYNEVFGSDHCPVGIDIALED